MKLRILVVDDQKTIRENIKAFLSKVTDLELVGTAVDGYEAIAKVKELKPDIILMDIEMPGLDGLEATKTISKQYPQVKVLILTSHDRDDLIAKSLSVGAQGYLLKNMPHAEIIRAIRFVVRGYTKIKPNIGITAQGIESTDNNIAVANIQSNANTVLSLAVKSENADYLRLSTPNEFLPPIKNWLVMSGLACLGIFVSATALASVLKYKVEDLKQITNTIENIDIRAPLAGTIQTLNLRNSGQVVRSGDEIATIAPSDSALIIKAFVSSGDIGKIEVGQTTQMRVSACSYSDFGTLEGTVATVSPDTKDLTETTASYEISIKPKMLSWKSDARNCVIRPGMEGRVDIISDEETVLQFLLRKIRLAGN